MKGSRAKGRGGLEIISEFYALLATRFFQRMRLHNLRGARLYAGIIATVLAPLFLYVFWPQSIRVVC